MKNVLHVNNNIDFTFDNNKKSYKYDNKFKCKHGISYDIERDLIIGISDKKVLLYTKSGFLLDSYKLLKNYSTGYICTHNKLLYVSTSNGIDIYEWNKKYSYKESINLNKPVYGICIYNNEILYTDANTLSNGIAYNKKSIASYNNIVYMSPNAPLIFG